jgi:hypothetical protein
MEDLGPFEYGWGKGTSSGLYRCNPGANGAIPSCFQSMSLLRAWEPYNKNN